MTSNTIRVNDEAYAKYVDMTKHIGKGKKEMASSALISGFELIEMMNEYDELVKTEVTKEMFSRLINEKKGSN